MTNPTPEHEKKAREICRQFVDVINYGLAHRMVALALAEAEERGRPKWIACSERMPEFPPGTNAVTCSVLTDVGHVVSMEWTRNPYAATPKGREPRWKWLDRNSPWDVSAWQPLPEPPR